MLERPLLGRRRRGCRSMPMMGPGSSRVVDLSSWLFSSSASIEPPYPNARSSSKLLCAVKLTIQLVAVGGNKGLFRMCCGLSHCMSWTLSGVRTSQMSGSGVGLNFDLNQGSPSRLQINSFRPPLTALQHLSAVLGIDPHPETQPPFCQLSIPCDVDIRTTLLTRGNIPPGQDLAPCQFSQGKVAGHGRTTID